MHLSQWWRKLYKNDKGYMPNSLEEQKQVTKYAAYKQQDETLKMLEIIIAFPLEHILPTISSTEPTEKFSWITI